MSFTHVPPRPGIAFLYGSRESLEPGVAAPLLDAGGVIGESLARSEAMVRRSLGWSLREALSRCSAAGSWRDAESVREPALTAIQIALTDAWHAQGLVPQATAGRCGGECAAGYGSGSLTHEEAMDLACRLSRVMAAGAERGYLVCVDRSVAEMARVQRTGRGLFHVAGDASSGRSVLSLRSKHYDDVVREMALRSIAVEAPAKMAPAHCSLLDEFRGFFLGADESAPIGRRGLVRQYSPASGGIGARRTCYGDWWSMARQPMQIGRLFDEMVTAGHVAFIHVSGSMSMESTIQEASLRCGAPTGSFPSMRPGETVGAVMDETLRRLDPLRV